MCSKIAAKLINSSDESSMGSAVYFSRRVFTENLEQRHTEEEGFRKATFLVFSALHERGGSGFSVLYPADKCPTVSEPGDNSGEEDFFPFLGTTPSYHTEVTPIVLCTAQCSPSVLWQCYHENNTINPLSFQPLCTLCFQVPLGLVSLRDRPASKNDQIIPSPLIYTWWSDLFRAAAVAALVWLLTSRALVPAAPQSAALLLAC